MTALSLQIYALTKIPKPVKENDNLGDMICSQIDSSELKNLQNKDVVVVSQKIVSLAQGRIKELNKVNITNEADQLSKLSNRNADMCQIILDESKKIVGIAGGNMIVTQHKLGFDCTNAGIDRSNVAPFDQKKVSLLPENSDKTAREIKSTIYDRFEANVAVLIIDSFGRPDRKGSISAVIGLAGIPALIEETAKDIYENERKSAVCLVDEIASAASIVMGKTKGIPVAIVRGVDYQVKDDEYSIQDCLLKEEERVKQFDANFDSQRFKNPKND